MERQLQIIEGTGSHIIRKKDDAVPSPPWNTLIWTPARFLKRSIHHFGLSDFNSLPSPQAE